MSQQTNAAFGPAPRLFDTLEQDDFRRLEHAASLKGLLRPFKGKGELAHWAHQSEFLREQLLGLSRQLLSQVNVYPFSLLPVVLAHQSTSAGTVFLRWRRPDRSAMGVSLWREVIGDAATPLALVHELFALEQQRLVLNMQISLVHTIARQAIECAAKLAQAEDVYRERVLQSNTTQSTESHP